MGTALIVPLYKQSKYWQNLITGISRQSVMPDMVYVVIDRPVSDPGCVDSITKINSDYPAINIQILVCNPPNTTPRTDRPEFFAGLARNIGLNQAIHDGYDTFIFIDGDCVPQRKLVESHQAVCKAPMPILSVGRRREASYRWCDKREVDSSLAHLNLFDEKGTLINSPELIKQCLIIWSCNIALNKLAVDRLIKFNEVYYNRKELFSSDFNGEWGGEDSFLGIEAWYCRIFITTIGTKSSGVEHIDHPRPSTTHTINHKKYFDEQVERLRKKVVINPLRIEFFY